MTFAIAMKILSDTTRCESIDKALVIWDSFQQAAGSFLSNPFLQTFKNAKALIEYHWARGNYQACVVLGYEQQCEIGKAAFQRFSKTSLRELGIGEHDREAVANDINAVPLRISYSKLRSLFETHDYLAAAKLAEDLIGGFDRNARYWDHISISKSRLYADAAVSWLHFADSLAATADLNERKRRCEAYDRALANAQNAQWFNFRQDHVHFIEQRAASCRQGLQLV